MLCVPSSADTLTLHTDASGLGVGAVLTALRGGKEVPTAFFSRQLRGAEKNYSTTEWESLAIVGSGRLAVPQHRVEALAGYIKPKTAKDMRSFLGTMSYYRKFIDSYANYSSLLSPSTSKNAPREVQWTSELEDQVT